MIKVFMVVWVVGSHLPLYQVELVDYSLDECKYEAEIVVEELEHQNTNENITFEVTCEIR